MNSKAKPLGARQRIPLSACAALAACTLGTALTSAQTLPPPPVSPTPVTQYEYDAEGNPTKTIVAPGTRTYATQHAYDTLGRRTTTTNAKNGLTQFSYDLQDQLTSVTDPRSLVTQYQPTGLGDVKSLISPDTGTASSTFDAAGNLKTRTDARGVLATYTYDALNRVTQIAYSRTGNSTRVVNFTYDETGSVFGSGIGRLTTSKTQEVSTRFRYDALGRVTQTFHNLGSMPTIGVGYGYNANGTLGTLTYPSGRAIWYSWANGQLQSMGITAGGVSSTLLDHVVMHPTGAVQSWTWQLGGTGRLHKRVFDTSGRIVRYPLGPWVRDITYDDVDRISRFTHYDASTAQPAPTVDQSFTYDELDRLISAAGSTSWSYAYDANGNRTASAVGTVARAFNVSATSNRLTGLTNPARDMTYSATGDTLTDVQSGSSANYTAEYFLDGRMATLSQGSAWGVSFSYDAQGRRFYRSAWIGSTSNPRVVTLFAYDQDNHLLGEYQADGKPITEYVWLGDTPVAVVKTDAAAPGGIQVYAIHADHLDTPRVILDAQGNVRWRWMGEPFGSSPAEEQPTAGLAALQQNLRFPGQQYEAFGGRFYNHFRDYDPTTGRYVQSDPIGLNGGINTYSYVNGNPLSRIDPFGLFDDATCAITGDFCNPQADPRYEPPNRSNRPTDEQLACMKNFIKNNYSGDIGLWATKNFSLLSYIQTAGTLYEGGAGDAWKETLMLGTEKLVLLGGAQSVLQLLQSAAVTSAATGMGGPANVVVFGFATKGRGLVHLGEKGLKRIAIPATIIATAINRQAMSQCGCGQ